MLHAPRRTYMLATQLCISIVMAAYITELGSYTWRVKDWASHAGDKKTLLSDVFEVGGLPSLLLPQQ